MDPLNIPHGLRYFGWHSGDLTDADRYILPIMVNLLPRHNNLVILDAGCGNGFISNFLTEMGHSVIGVDHSEDGIQVAKDHYPNVDCFSVYSVYDDFCLITGPVDVVISIEVIEHLYSPRRFISNAFSILRPGGTIIMSTPYHGYMKNLALSLFNFWDMHFSVNWEGGHIKFFSKKTLNTLLIEAGFVDIRFKGVGRIYGFWKSMVCRAHKK